MAPRPPAGNSLGAVEPSISPVPSDEEAAAIVAALEVLWPRGGGDGGRPAPGIGVALQRALVEPADPASARPPLGVTWRPPSS